MVPEREQHRRMVLPHKRHVVKPPTPVTAPEQRTAPENETIARKESEAEAALKAMQKKLADAGERENQLQQALKATRDALTTQEQAAMTKTAESNGTEAALHQSLAEVEDENQTLKQQLLQAQQKQQQSEQVLKTAQQSNSDLQVKMNALAQKQTQGEAALSALQQKLDNAQQAVASQSQPAVAPAPKSADEIRDYALGASWAQEMLGMMEQKAKLGYAIGYQQVLSGAADMFNNNLQVGHDQLAASLKALYADSAGKEQAKTPKGSAWVSAFREQPGVKKAAMGYDYLIADRGKGKIKRDSVVSIVVRESLTNGKVINDMLEKGTVLTLPLGKYPPLFKSAISLLGDKGEIRLVVPPSLAYGEKGRAPDIPPNSTMVYDVKVMNVQG
jgi:epidermal growth factor receptor substrate 15